MSPKQRFSRPPELVALPPRRLRFSRGVSACSAVLVLAGISLVFTAWRFGPVAGAICAALGLGLFFVSGYYWTCDNETCS